MINRKVRNEFLSTNDISSELGTLPIPERRAKSTDSIWHSDEVNFAQNEGSRQWHAWIIQFGLWVLVIFAGFTMIPRLMVNSSSKEEIKKHNLPAQISLITPANIQEQHPEEKKIPIRMEATRYVADQKRDAGQKDKKMAIEALNKENAGQIKNTVNIKEEPTLEKQQKIDDSITQLQAIGIFPPTAASLPASTLQTGKSEDTSFTQAKLGKENNRKLDQSFSSEKCSEPAIAMHLCNEN